EIAGINGEIAGDFSVSDYVELGGGRVGSDTEVADCGQCQLVAATRIPVICGGRTYYKIHASRRNSDAVGVGGDPVIEDFQFDIRSGGIAIRTAQRERYRGSGRGGCLRSDLQIAQRICVADSDVAAGVVDLRSRGCPLASSTG